MSRLPNVPITILLATARWLMCVDKLTVSTLRIVHKRTATDRIAAVCRLVNAEARQRREDAHAHGIVVEPVAARVRTRKRRVADTPTRQAHSPRASTMHPRGAAMDVQLQRALEPARWIGTQPQAPRAAVVAALRAQSERREQDRRLDAVVTVLPTLCDRVDALEQDVATIAASARMVVVPLTPQAEPTVRTLMLVLRDGIRAFAGTMRRTWHRCFRRVLG